MLYTEKMSSAIHLVKRPFPGFVMDIVEHPSTIELRVYEDQVMPMPKEKQMLVLEYLAECQKIISAFGVRCEVNGVSGRPPRRT